MRVTANQVTLARLVLLPAPVALLYRSGPGFPVAAFSVFVLLGLTDAVDGILARRHGTTPLGALLDPLADKFFLVATWMPVADLRLAPTSFVVVLFGRELLVTALRTIALEESFSFATSRVAKLKTTVQMAGAGFMFLVQFIPEGGSIGPILGAIVVGSFVPLAAAVVRGRVPGWKAAWGAGLIGGIGLCRWLGTARFTVLAIAVATLAFTVYSGVEYLVGMRGVLRARLRRSPLESFRLAGLSLSVPVFFVPLCDRPWSPVFLVMGLLAAELAAGGIDNSIVRPGQGRAAWGDFLRFGIQAFCGAVLLAAGSGLSRAGARILVAVPLGYSLVDSLARFVVHREVFLSAFASRPASGTVPERLT